MNVSDQSPNASDPMGGARPRGEDSSKASYSCPVYKYKARNDTYLIFRVNLKSDSQVPRKSSKLLKSMTTPMK